MAKAKRPPLPVGLQAEVFFRDQWLCHVCRRPVILHWALKRLAVLVASEVPSAHPAYWTATWRRDAAPLLDELAASIDHVAAFSKGGAHDISNFAAICARCNARKSASTRDAFIAASKPWAVKGKYGEPQDWDGLSSVFLALARQASDLTAVERQWLAVLDRHLSVSNRAGR